MPSPARRRVVGLMALAERVRDGDAADFLPLFRAILPEIELSDVRVHWQLCIDAVERAHKLDDGRLDYTEPELTRLPVSSRDGAATELAKAEMVEAWNQAARCVSVHDSRVLGRYFSHPHTAVLPAPVPAPNDLAVPFTAEVVSE